jgi:type VI secretion system secreted protein Hcp
MALEAYMKITGQKSGAINGPVTKKGHENTIEVLDLTYSLLNPHDLASGLASGKAQHQPVQVTVATGKHTALLYGSAVAGENLTSVEIDFYTTSASGAGTGAATGQEQQLFMIKLTNAAISEFDLNLDSSGASADLLDQYSFTFQKITMTYPKGGYSAVDNWQVKGSQGA